MTEPVRAPQPSGSREESEALLNRLCEPWTFGGFLRSWLKVDIIMRILIVILLGLVPILLLSKYVSHLDATEEWLKVNSSRPRMMAANPEAFANPQSVTETARYYEEVVKLAEFYRNTGRDYLTIQLTSASLLIVMVALAIIGEVQRSRALGRIRGAIEAVRGRPGSGA